MRTNEPNMNITNQINAGLQDVRKTLIELSETPIVEDAMEVVQQKVRYQVQEIITMILNHQSGISIPWSDRRYQVEEEFS